MRDRSAEERDRNIRDARDCLSKSIELLSKDDVFGAVLQLHKARTLLDSVPEVPSEPKSEERHDWAVLDPYTAQCRLCGKRRPLGVEERTLDTLAR